MRNLPNLALLASFVLLFLSSACLGSVIPNPTRPSLNRRRVLEVHNDTSIETRGLFPSTTKKPIKSITVLKTLADPVHGQGMELPENKIEMLVFGPGQQRPHKRLLSTRPDATSYYHRPLVAFLHKPETDGTKHVYMVGLMGWKEQIFEDDHKTINFIYTGDNISLPFALGFVTVPVPLQGPFENVCLGGTANFANLKLRQLLENELTARKTATPPSGAGNPVTPPTSGLASRKKPTTTVPISPIRYGSDGKF